MNTNPDDTEPTDEERHASNKINTKPNISSTLDDFLFRPDYWGGMLGSFIPLLIYKHYFYPGGLPDTDIMWIQPFILGGLGGVLAGKKGKGIVIRGLDEGSIQAGLGFLGGIIAAAITSFFRQIRILV